MEEGKECILHFTLDRDVIIYNLFIQEFLFLFENV